MIKAEAASNPDRIELVFESFHQRQATATGTWKFPGACNQSLSAISTSHIARKNMTGCRFHPVFARLWWVNYLRNLKTSRISTEESLKSTFPNMNYREIHPFSLTNLNSSPVKYDFFGIFAFVGCDSVIWQSISAIGREQFV